MKSGAETVKEYLAGLPPERRKAVEAVRRTIRKHLPKGYEEGMQYGMIGYYVPHRLFPAGYHCDPKQPLPFAGLASQKNHMAVYLMCIYGDPDHLAWFQEAWKKSGKKLDMGKSCIRFKKLEDVALDVLGKAIAKVPVKRFVEHYESALAGGGERRAKRAKATEKTAKKATTKKAAKKRASKSTASRKTSKKATTAKRSSR